MKSYLLTFAILLISILQYAIANEINTQDPRFGEIRDNTVIPYFETLQRGDVESLRQYLSARRYAINQNLIEQNASYPNFLRDQFQDANFELVSLVEDGTKINAVVKIYWPDGHNTQTNLGLIEESSNNHSTANIKWKIDRD